jgi:hypothetical protein
VRKLQVTFKLKQAWYQPELDAQSAMVLLRDQVRASLMLV